jgi:4-hydroxy-tetrahydrodipicolinate reductase
MTTPLKIAPLKIGVTGASGRMGRIIITEIMRSNTLVLSGATVGENDPNIGMDVGEICGLKRVGKILKHNPVDMFESADVIIDFTTPAASLEHCLLANRYKKPLVIGTTGFNDKQKEMLHQHGQNIPIVGSPNMSLGVNLLLAVTEYVAGLLDDEFDIEITEMHHRHKVDSPSGTALALGRAAAKGRKVTLEDKAVYDRAGKREQGQIGFAVARGGDVVGDHTVMFCADGERLEITHKASSRQIFARGAVKAAEWLHGKPAGLYSMKDVLNLRLGS